MEFSEIHSQENVSPSAHLSKCHKMIRHTGDVPFLTRRYHVLVTKWGEGFDTLLSFTSLMKGDVGMQKSVLLLTSVALAALIAREP